MDVSKKTGVSVPLAAIRTEDSPVIGEYTALVEFAAFAKKAGLSVIQLLPILDSGAHSSPYSSLSAFALHPIYINVSRVTGFQTVFDSDADFVRLYKKLLSHKNDVRFDYQEIRSIKNELLRKIFRRLAYSATPDIPDKCERFHAFINRCSVWLPSYCVFKTLKAEHSQEGWWNWKKQYRSLSAEKILEIWNSESRREPNFFYAWLQLMAFRQFSEAANEVRKMGIVLKGDLPILLNEDSCDVWANPDLFSTKWRAGSPPDGDNPAGQNWGFPIYDWEAHQKSGFSWWKKRLAVSSVFFDAYRLDHLPGFFRFWAVNERDCSAEMGVNMPNCAISATSLFKADFSRERVKWLSEPHIPTEEVFRLTGNLDRAHEILSLLCDRIGHEELWNFKKTIKGERDIRLIDFSQFELDFQIQKEMTELFVRWWKNRTLLEIKRGNFVPACKFRESVAWNSLSSIEKNALENLFVAAWKKQDVLQGAQARTIFSEVLPSSSMIPCGEDLGALPLELPATMDEFGILGLKVIRWCRKWSENGQPFDDLKKIRPLSVATTSVHDSSTLRSWWNDEKDSVRAFVRDFFESDDEHSENKRAEQLLSEVPLSEREYDNEIAQWVLDVCAETSALWFINPIQDWLYLDKKYYAKDASDERINIPGTVSDFNWTWRMPVCVSKLIANENFCEKIQKIAKIHDEFVCKNLEKKTSLV